MSLDVLRIVWNEWIEFMKSSTTCSWNYWFPSSFDDSVTDVKFFTSFNLFCKDSDSDWDWIMDKDDLFLCKFKLFCIQ